MGEADTPRSNGALCFAARGSAWRSASPSPLAGGHFEWEDFREELIAEIDGWEKSHALDDPSWDYYERWLHVLERLVAARLPDLASSPAP